MKEVYRSKLLQLANQFIEDSPSKPSDKQSLLLIFQDQIDDTLNLYNEDALQTQDACDVLWQRCLSSTFSTLLGMLECLMKEALVNNKHFSTRVNCWQIKDAIEYLQQRLSLVEVFNHCMDCNRDVWLKCVEFVQGEKCGCPS